jgi:hypothetical protein
MGISRKIPALRDRRIAVERDFDAARFILGDLRRGHARAIFESFPDFHPYRAGGNVDLDLTPGIKEPAQITNRRLAHTVSQRRVGRSSGPLPGECVRREIIRFWVIKVSIGSDHVHAAEGWFPAGRVANRHFQMAARRRRFEDGLPGTVEPGGREQDRFVVRARGFPGPDQHNRDKAERKASKTGSEHGGFLVQAQGVARADCQPPSSETPSSALPQSAGKRRRAAFTPSRRRGLQSSIFSRQRNSRDGSWRIRSGSRGTWRSGRCASFSSIRRR